MPPLTLAEYTSAERFPLTTQTGLTPEQQMRIDAFNHDQLKGAIEEGYPMTDEDRRRWAELQEKIAAQPAIIRELRESGNGGGE